MPRAEDGAVIKVPVTTLDRLSGTCSRVDFIKIDAEGAEEAIIEGMGETIARHKPMLVVEFNPGRYVDARGFLERLAGIYGSLRRLDFSGEAIPMKSDDLLTNYGGDDSLLVLSRDRPA